MVVSLISVRCGPPQSSSFFVEQCVNEVLLAVKGIARGRSIAKLTVKGRARKLEEGLVPTMIRDYAPPNSFALIIRRVICLRAI